MSEHTLERIEHQVVRASAGAGKTYQLTTRYLKLLSLGEPPPNILATTFTRKAAGEVLARVLGRLSAACVDGEACAELSQALGRALTQTDCTHMLRGMTDQLGRLSVGTIDGFFNRSARAMGLELGMPPDPRLIDEGSAFAKQMRADAIQAVLDEQADTDEGMQTLIEMLRRLHHDTAERKVAEAIDQIVTDLLDVYRSYPDPALWQTLTATGLKSADAMAAIRSNIEAMQDAIPKTQAGNPNVKFSNAYDDILACFETDQWAGLLEITLVKKIIAGEDKFASAQITDEWRDVVQPLIEHAAAHRIKELADQTHATYKLLGWFDHYYHAIRWRQRTLLFSDLTHLLAAGLPEMGEFGVEELCYRLDTRVTHLLLDEFQDTSLKQWQVLEPFAEQITDNYDDSRSLFCVGDTKQAIYGWRGGCAELFEVVEQLPAVEQLTLSKSWRSSQAVLDAVNRVFSGLSLNPALDEVPDVADSWQAGFTEHTAAKRDLPGHVVVQTTATGDQDPASNQGDDEDDPTAPPDAHAHYVANHIKDLLATMPGRSIGVLMRSRAKAAVLINALRGLGVDAAEEGGNPIAHTPAVAAVLAAIRLADHPGDTVARFHVINSPVGKVVGLDGKDTDMPAVARHIRRELIDHGYAGVIADWVRKLAPCCDAKSLRRLEQLVGLAERFDEHDATLRPGFFVDSVQSMRVEDASPAPVRVMTIHASKGLEFDAVVLPDLDATLSAQDSKSLIMLDRASPIAPVDAIYRRVKKEQAKLLPELKRAYDQHTLEKRTEDLCLLYVAMTRAKQSLHMLIRPLKQGKKKGAPTGEPTSFGLTNLSYASILRQALRDIEDEGFEGGQRLHESGNADWPGPATDPQDQQCAHETIPPVNTPLRLAKPSTAPRRSWAATTPSAMHAQGNVSAQDLLRMTDTGGRSYGSLMHKLFEQVGYIDDGPPAEEALRAAARPLIAQSPDLDIDAAITQFHQAMQQPAIIELLKRNDADVLWRERPFVVRLDGQLVNGTIDRAHLWRQGGSYSRALLIDFKTDRVDDSTVDRVVADYADQLNLYRKAVSSMLALDESLISAKLCFVGDGRVVDVPA